VALLGRRGKRHGPTIVDRIAIPRVTILPSV